MVLKLYLAMFLITVKWQWKLTDQFPGMFNEHSLPVGQAFQSARVDCDTVTTKTLHLRHERYSDVSAWSEGENNQQWYNVQFGLYLGHQNAIIQTLMASQA